MFCNVSYLKEKGIDHHRRSKEELLINIPCPSVLGKLVVNRPKDKIAM